MMTMVTMQRSAPLIRPNGLGYLHIGAELERPRRRAVRKLVVTASAGLATLEGVRRVDCFEAIVMPSPAGAGEKALHAQGRRRAAFDLVVLVECATPERAAELRGHPAVQLLLDALSGARRVHVAALSNARRIAEVAKDRGGVFLFNYFVSADADQMLAVWERTAGWFTSKANLDNSTLLQPVDPATCDYTVINHCRWDGLLDILPHLALRPSRRAVDASFAAADIVAMPILYRLTASDGVPAPRALVGPSTLGLGTLHLLATIPAIADAAPRIAERGLFGGVSADLPPPADAMQGLAMLFSLVVGVLLLVTAGLCWRLERARMRLPAWLGPTLALTGLAGGLLLPPSGFWLVALLGLVVMARRVDRRGLR